MTAARCPRNKKNTNDANEPCPPASSHHFCYVLGDSAPSPPGTRNRYRSGDIDASTSRAPSFTPLPRRSIEPHTNTRLAPFVRLLIGEEAHSDNMYLQNWCLRHVRGRDMDPHYYVPVDSPSIDRHELECVYSSASSRCQRNLSSRPFWET